MTLTPSGLEALCAAAMPEERISALELEHVCFGDGDAVVGDETAAAAYRVTRFGEYVTAWLLLVAVRPEEQGRGRGKALVTEVVDRARAAGAAELHLANAIPRFLWPGVPLDNTRAGMLAESFGFDEGMLGVNMEIPTSFHREPPAGVVIEAERATAAVEFAARAYPHWVPELERAVDLGTAFAARAADGTTIGFGCHSVLRRGWIGPMATDPGLQHGGVGSAVLAALCADLERGGVATGEVCWVSNLRFYGKCGATVSRVFRAGKRRL